MIRTLALLSALVGSPALAAPCAPRDPAAVAGAMSAMYAAAERDDAAAFHDLLDPGFYAFDNGKRFDGMALPDLIKSAHAAGKTYHWAVTKPDVRLVCNTAWIAYLNQGTISDASGAQPMTWLESALLQYKGGAWRILFLQSERASGAH